MKNHKIGVNLLRLCLENNELTPAELFLSGNVEVNFG